MQILLRARFPNGVSMAELRPPVPDKLPPRHLFPTRWASPLSTCHLRTGPTKYSCTSAGHRPPSCIPRGGNMGNRSHQVGKMGNKPRADQGTPVAVSSARVHTGRLLFSGASDPDSSRAVRSDIRTQGSLPPVRLHHQQTHRAHVRLLPVLCSPCLPTPAVSE